MRTHCLSVSLCPVLVSGRSWNLTPPPPPSSSCTVWLVGSSGCSGSSGASSCTKYLQAPTHHGVSVMVTGYSVRVRCLTLICLCRLRHRCRYRTRCRCWSWLVANSSRRALSPRLQRVVSWLTTMGAWIVVWLHFLIPKLKFWVTCSDLGVSRCNAV